MLAPIGLLLRSIPKPHPLMAQLLKLLCLGDQLQLMIQNRFQMRSRRQ
jgi:hypothetical protein